MGLSLEQAERLGIATEHPDHPSRKSEAAKKRPHVPATNDKGQNKGEAQLDRYLADLKSLARIDDYRFEPIKIRLAGKCFYRIDFVVKRLNGSLVGLEYKCGFIRDDGAIKMKLAPEIFPFLEYFMVRKDRACTAGWDVRRITRNGIGVHPVGEDWIA